MAARGQSDTPETPILFGLALAAGSLDAISYLGLGRVFPANMTGNTVLLMLGVAQGDGGQIGRTAAALGGFALGVVAGVLLLPAAHGNWPSAASRALALEVALLVTTAVWWIGAGNGALHVLIVLAAATMGVQSAAVRASTVRGVTTTYMTGTYMHAIARAVERRRGGAPRSGPAGLPGQAWGTYAAGALLGALTVTSWHAWAALVPTVIVAAITAAVWRSTKQEQ